MRKRLTLLAMCIAQGMILLDVTIVNIALPSIQRELHELVTRALGTGQKAAAEQAFSHGYQVAVLIAGLCLIAGAIVAASGLRDDRGRELDAAGGKPASIAA